MSENTPDSASGLAMDTSDMGTSNLDAGDNEPSMEDILASIRQIIADDEVEDAADALTGMEEDAFGEPEELIKSEIAIELDTPKNIDEVVESEGPAKQEDNHDILDLMNFMDENAEEADSSLETIIGNNEVDADISLDVQGEAAEKVLDIDAPTVGFDEGLDLVMDADASDYLTTQVGPNVGQVDDSEFLLENELFADIERQNGNDEESLIIPEIPENAQTGTEPQSSVAGIAEVATVAAGQVHVNQDEDMDLVKSLLADLMDDEPVEEEDTSLEDDGVDLHSDFEQALSDANVSAETDEIIGATPDIDFVTGEAIDASSMDAIFDDNQQSKDQEAIPETEPTIPSAIPEVKQETTVESGEAVSQERDFVTGELIDSIDEDAIFGGVTPSVLDEVLQKSVEGEVALHDQLETVPQEPEVEPKLKPETILKGSYNNELSGLPEGITPPADVDLAVETQVADTVTNDDDDVVVLPEIDADRKFSLLAKTTVGASALGLGAAALLQKDDIEEEIFAEVPGAKLERPTEEQQELPPQKNESNKDKTMAQAEKTETILDTETLSGSASAFASLNTAVQEKTKMQESGPAIGDLVQEALKPMLKDWLDKNLKGIVERAVTKEVKRISSGK